MAQSILKRQQAKLLIVLALCATFIFAAATERPSASNLLQQTYPQPPSDRTLIYVADEKGTLTALPFETATTPLRIAEVAKGNKMSYLELKGERAATTLNTTTPRFYLFIKDQPGLRPAFLVRLTDKKSARRVAAFMQKGLSGFAVPSEEIVRPRFLVLKREDGMLFMEVQPRYPLASGEYAFVGSDVARIASFRINAP